MTGAEDGGAGNAVASSEHVRDPDELAFLRQRALESQKAANELFSSMAKNLLIVSGGAVALCLTFMANYHSQGMGTVVITRALGGPLYWFLAAVVAAAANFVTGWQWSIIVAREHARLKSGVQIRERVARVISMVFSGVALACLIAGTVLAKVALARL